MLQLDHARFDRGSTILPDELYSLTNLESLRLSNSNFSGTISTLIGNLIELKVLDLSGNNLIGTIPSEIGLVTNLETLKLNSNAMEDPTRFLPTEIVLLTSLRIFKT